MHTLHPHAARQRIADIEHRYNCKATDVRRSSNACWDAGGIHWLGWQWHDFDLGKRQLSVREIDLAVFAGVLRGRRVHELSGRQYKRLPTHPHHLIYISLADERKLLRQLRELDGRADKAWQQWREATCKSGS